MSDINTKVQNFNKDLQQLLKKYNLVLTSLAMILPNGTIGSRIHVMDEAEVKKSIDDGKKTATDVAGNSPISDEVQNKTVEGEGVNNNI